MSTSTVDELGPVNWIAVEFPGSRFNGAIAAELEELVDRDIVRILDLVMLRKADDGSWDAFELTEVDDSEAGQLRAYEVELAMLLSEQDAAAIADTVEPGSSAAIMVWEDRWATPFANAVRRSGGQLVSGGRIPVPALLAALEEDLEGNGE